MTKDNTPIALLNLDKAKGLHHIHGLITKANHDDSEDEMATSKSIDPDEDQDTQAGNPDNTRPTTQEDTDYKKRYFDLKAHHDKVVPDLRNENATLKSQVNAKPLDIPKTPEELSEFTKKYPESAAVFTSLIRTELMNERNNWEAEKEALRKEREDARLERNKELLLKAHPDAKAISESADFAAWFNEQPKGIKALIGSTDVQDTIKGFSIYKKEKGIKASVSEAAQRVKTGSKSSPDPEKRVYYESEIMRMSDREFSRLEQDILLANREGRVLKG